MNVRTGTLRQDIELIRPGIHGNYAMLFDPVAESYYRISPHTALIISRLDRDYELGEFQARLLKNGLEVSEEELLELIAFLQQNNLLAPEYGQYERRVEQQKRARQQTMLLRFASAYMFFRLPPWRPERFLKLIGPYVGFMAQRWFLTLLLIPALIGYLLAIRDFGTVRDMFVDSLSWAGLAKYFAAIVFLKVVHESSHALASIHFKCRIRAIGLSFIVFYPRLFTDTTDSWRLPRGQRLLIDAGGLIGELLVGGIAALIWYYQPPGILKSTMFYVFAVSTISTLLVNGNPLIRYDGYYILCDLLNVENLMMRSSEYVKQLWRYYFFHLGTPPQERRGWLLCLFGIASFFYRILLYTSIIMIIYHSFVRAVAVVLLLLEVYTIFLYPMYREFLTVRALSKRSGARANWFFGIAVLLVVGGVLFFPLSWNVTLPGEVRPETHELVTVTEAGFLTSKLSSNPRQVSEGELLFALEAPIFDFRVRKLENVLAQDELLFDLQQSDRKTFGDSLLTLEKIKSDRRGLAELERRREEREVLSRHNAMFVPNLGELSKGAFLPAGAVVGELFAAEKVVHAYATDREIRKLAPGQPVEILFTDRLDKARGRIRSVNPIPAVLRNSPLLQHFGGEIPVYIDEKKPGEYHSVLAMYRVEIEFDAPTDIQMGRTVRARVLHREVLAKELLRMLLSAFRREF